MNGVKSLLRVRLNNFLEYMISVDAKNENLNSLKQLLRLENEEAETVLNASVLITSNPSDYSAHFLGERLKCLLKLAVENIITEPTGLAIPSLEVIIGSMSAQTGAPSIWVAISEDDIIINSEQTSKHQKNICIHKILLLSGACYTAARCIKELAGEDFIFPVQDKTIIKYSDIIGSEKLEVLNIPTVIGEAVLVGAGAIGNGFILGLSYFNVSGELIIVDPDSVSDGNLNRCVLFTEADVGKNKALQLSLAAQRMLPDLNIVGEVVTLNDLKKLRGIDLFKRLVVAVDSRRARRNIQFEIPGEVFDASTTGITEIVLHYHKQPLGGKACLGCIYHEEEQEAQHEQHIADSLGVSLTDMKELFISEDAAIKIKSKYHELDVGSLVDQSYDTLFKQLCGQGQLLNSVDRQVFAPLSFVSVIAGVYLAIEVIKRSHLEENYNYWRISPWFAPIPLLKTMKATSKDCSFCNTVINIETADELWGK